MVASYGVTRRESESDERQFHGVLGGDCEGDKGREGVTRVELEGDITSVVTCEKPGSTVLVLMAMLHAPSTDHNDVYCGVQRPSQFGK